MGLAEIKARLAAQKAASSPVQSNVQLTQPIKKSEKPEQITLPIQLNKALPSGSELFNAVIELQTSLLDRHPRMPTLLREIHTALRAQPENVTLLNEDQISVIVNGLKVQTGVQFATAATKGSTKSLKAKIAAQGVDAF